MQPQSQSRSSAPNTTNKNPATHQLPVSSTHNAAFNKCVTAIVPDMPLLMHGAGDVVPSDANPATATCLAQLTAEYMTKLVSAAVDAHDILTDGAGGLLPPPPPHNHSGRPREIHPLPYSEERKHKRKRKTPGEEYWDDPVGDIVVKGIGTIVSSISASTTESDSASKPWVGLAGVDLQEATRTRTRHIQQAIGTQSFIFPICHDAELYQRVMQLQAARREIQSVLEDSVVMDMVLTENSKEDDEVLLEEAAAVCASEWPGLRALLPIHAYQAESDS